MNKRRVTSHDVARLAGVSRATVSYVLNNVKSVNISEKTSELVRAAAEKLRYVPDAAGTALVTRKTQIIGLVLSRDYHQNLASNVFLPQFIDGLMDVVQQHKLRLIIDTVEARKEPHAYMNLAHSKQIDGMIFFNPRLDDTEFRELVKDGLPSVVVGRVPNVDISYVDVDNEKGAQAAVEHLLALGHRRIGFMANAPVSFTSASDRLAGYRQMLDNAGLPLDENLICHGAFSSESGYSAMNDLLEQASDLTALFVASDEVAFGAIAALNDRGIRVPEDISVVGFDDVPTAPYFNPPLTTIKIPPFEMGKKTGELLMNLMFGVSRPGRRVLVETRLKVRRSTRAPNLTRVIETAAP